MAQIQTFSYTNPATAVAKNISLGFSISDITTIDITNGGSFRWVLGMAPGSWMNDAGAITDTDGFTPLEQFATYGASISGFTNDNPGVITVDDTVTFGFAIGDTIQVGEVSDNGADPALGLNGFYTIATVTDTTITLNEDTTALNAWVSGGIVTRVSDVDGFAIPTENFAIQGMTLGTDVVGGDNADVTGIASGENPVV